MTTRPIASRPSRPVADDDATIPLGEERWVELERVLGWGDDATVYAASLRTAHGLARPVALKLFARTASEEREAVHARLVASACRVAAIDHPNVARVYECGEVDGHFFLVTELARGPNLGAFQDGFARRGRRVPLDLGLFIAAEVAEALSAARLTTGPDGVQLGVLHRALGPREVLLTMRGEVKVTDFEISGVRASTSSIRNLRGIGARLGTMAPEVVQGGEADARADVFSLGVLLRELFIGPRFPQGITSRQALRYAREGYVEPFSFQPNLPPGLVAAMERALAVEPEHRYPNATPLAADLRREAFALGVGDGRYFLRAALERADDADAITAERPYLVPADDDDDRGTDPRRR